MKKLNEKQIQEIKRLRSEGLSTYKIAEKFGVAQSTICYHCDENQKIRVRYSSRKEYMKQYLKKRYKEDESFREKIKECSRNYKKKIRKDKEKQE